MKRNIIGTFIFMLLVGTTILPVSATVFIEHPHNILFNGKTLYVGGDGPNNFTAIFDAINEAEDGDTVYVYSGIYYETITVDKTITIQGEDKLSTIIDGVGNGDVVNINADNVKLHSFTIQNSGQGHGYEAGINIESDYSIITDNIISNNCWCADVRNSNYNIFSDNIIQDNTQGAIHLAFSRNNIVSNNTILNNRLRGVMLYSSGGNKITSNTFLDGGLEVYGSSHNSIYSNTVNGKSLVYLEDESNKIIDDAGQVILIRCTGITVQNLVLSYSSIGLQVRDSIDCNVIDNSILHNSQGVAIVGSSRILLEGNTINENWYTGVGVYHDKGGTKILKNNIQDNKNGLYIFNCVLGVDINSNIISENENGILVHSGSKFCTISENVISSNSGYGIDLSQSDGNIIYKNNFENNGVNAYMEYHLKLGFNKWSLATKGNYWDDWIGTGPKIIYGKIYLIIGEGYNFSIPWINFDWYPSTDPYLTKN